MSDWQVGDLAVCVDASPQHGRVPTGLKNGEVYRVAGVTIHSGNGHTLLVIDKPEVIFAFSEGAPGAWRFRRILPDKHEACEDEFVTLLKRSKRPVRA